METVEPKKTKRHWDFDLPEGLGRIYALSHPSNPSLPVYIGRTKASLKRRIEGHISTLNQPRNKNRPICEWLRGLKSQEITPVIYTLEVCSVDKLSDREHHWILFFRPLGTLLNVDDGDSVGQRRFSRDAIKRATDRIIAQTIKQRKPIVNDAGQVFESVQAAGRAFGKGPSNIIKAIRSGIKSYGHHWKYYEPTN